jgi:hypothetical protein
MSNQWVWLQASRPRKSQSLPLNSSVRRLKMRIYDIKDSQDRIFAFEVPNFGRQRACKFVSRIPGTKVFRQQKHFELESSDEFCEFEFQKQTFVIQEPFGDNSRFWIGPKPPEWCPQLEALRVIFQLKKAFVLF